MKFKINLREGPPIITDQNYGVPSVRLDATGHRIYCGDDFSVEAANVLSIVKAEPIETEKKDEQ